MATANPAEAIPGLPATDDPWLKALRIKAQAELSRVYAAASEADRLRAEVVRLRHENQALRGRIESMRGEAHARLIRERSHAEPLEGRH